MKVKMTIEVEIDDDMYDDEESRLWLLNEILVGDGSLILHSSEIGDEVGYIKSVKNVQFENKTPNHG